LKKDAADFLLDIAKLLIGGIVIALFITSAFLLLWWDKKTKKK